MEEKTEKANVQPNLNQMVPPLPTTAYTNKLQKHEGGGKGERYGTKHMRGQEWTSVWVFNSGDNTELALLLPDNQLFCFPLKIYFLPHACISWLAN